MKGESDWRINDAASKEAVNEVTYAGLRNPANGGNLWFSEKEDLEFICNALNFYQTYKPLMDELKENMESLLDILNQKSL